MVIEVGGLTEGEIIKELGIMECGHGINVRCPGGQAVGGDKRPEAALKQVELIILESQLVQGLPSTFPDLYPSVGSNSQEPIYILTGDWADTTPTTGRIQKVHCRSYRAYDVYIRIKRID